MCQYLLQIQRRAVHPSKVLAFLPRETKTNAKVSLPILQAFYRSQPSVNWVCFTGGTVAPSGHLSLIDEAHMWAPYASWQGQRGAVTLEPGGL